MTTDNTDNRTVFAGQQWLLLAPFLVPAILIIITAVLLLRPGMQPLSLMPLLAADLLSLLGALWWLRKQLLVPMVQLEDAVTRVAQGEPEASLPIANSGALAGLVRDIYSMSEELTELYEDMDSRVAKHTTRLAQKTAALKILYDVAASVNQMSTLDDLLVRFLRVLKEMVNGKSASVRVMRPDSTMQLVAGIGLNNKLALAEEMLPLELCLCGAPLSPGDIICKHSAKYCTKKLGRTMYSADEVRQLVVPLQHKGNILGEYKVYISNPGVSEREDIMEILDSVGNHLGMAIAKQQSDEEARRLSIVEERNALAHELHDSLAQTLAGLRFQVSMLSDTLHQQALSETAGKDLLRLQNGVEEAHMELRELLNSFRAPVDRRGLVSSLERMLLRFGEDTGIASYFQMGCQGVNLNSSEEMQMLRIVQEALANIRKHAQAHTARVLLSCRSDGTYVLLIEDDGLGFEEGQRIGHPGEHIGLSIMEERAQRLGGKLRVESESGEGTRVELEYKPLTINREPRKHWII